MTICAAALGFIIGREEMALAGDNWVKHLIVKEFQRYLHSLSNLIMIFKLSKRRLQ